MTLTIIFIMVVLLGILLYWWGITKICDGIWRALLGSILILVAGGGLVINLVLWLPSEKDSEIQYYMYQQEKLAIETMLESGEEVDRLLLNQRVIDYNNRVIKSRANSQRPIYRDYYSKNVDWLGLELIVWGQSVKGQNIAGEEQ